MTTSLSSRSSWIEAILYKSFPDGSSYLAVLVNEKNWPVDSHNQPVPVAYLYGGPANPLPAWLPGMLAAGTPKKVRGKNGEEKTIHSPGRAYWRLMREKGMIGQKIEGREEVEKLKEMMR